MATTLNLIGVRGESNNTLLLDLTILNLFLPKKLHYKTTSSLGMLGSGSKLPNKKSLI